MSPQAIFRIQELKRPKKIGHLHEDDFHELRERKAELRKQGVKVA
jgi:hypothetical protein